MPTDWATYTAHTHKTKTKKKQRKTKKGRRSHSIHRKTFPQYLLNFYEALSCEKDEFLDKLFLCLCVSDPLLVCLSLCQCVFEILFVFTKPLYFAARIHLVICVMCLMSVYSATLSTTVHTCILYFDVMRVYGVYCFRHIFRYSLNIFMHLKKSVSVRIPFELDVLTHW